MDDQGPIEVAISSDLRGAPYLFTLWDIYTGAQLAVYKGIDNNPIKSCIQMINSEYFIVAVDKVLQIRSIYNQKIQDDKLILPGRPSSLSVSPCGNYLVVGIAETLFVWQLCSGYLLAQSQHHVGTIRLIKFSQDGTFLFTGGEDGFVLVWHFGDLISANISKSDIDPRHRFQDHASMITGMHITNSGLCITSSTDKSINIYSYMDGIRHFHISNLGTPICSIIMNLNETELYIGGEDGKIYTLSMTSIRSPPTILSGHKDKVTNLSLSLDGSLLISGSADSTCKIWDLCAGKMIRDVRHQAPIANLVTTLIPKAFAITSISQSSTKQPLVLSRLRRELYRPSKDLSVESSLLFDDSAGAIFQIRNKRHTYKENDKETKSSHNSADQATIAELKAKLKELYVMSSEKIFEDAARLEKRMRIKGSIE